MMRRLFIAGALLAWLIAPVFGAVAFDAKGTAACDATAATITCSTLTIGTGGSNYALVAFVAYTTSSQGNVSPMTATWNGVSMTLLGNTTNTVNTGSSAIFCLAAPTSGNHALVVTTTAPAAGELHIIGVSFSGVNQTTPCANYHGVVNGSGTTITNTVTSATGDIAASVFNNDQQGAGTNPNLNGTPITAYGTDFNGPSVSMEANYIAGAASVSLTDTAGGAVTHWSAAGVDIQSSGGAPPACSPMRSMRGVGC